MSNTHNQHINDLQTQLAFQEDIIEQLSSALADQQRQIDKLSFQLKHVIDKLKQIEPSSIASSSEEAPPPHY